MNYDFKTSNDNACMIEYGSMIYLISHQDI